MIALSRWIESSNKRPKLAIKFWCNRSCRNYTNDGRNRLSNYFIPSGGIDDAVEKQGKGVALLVKSGFIRQAHSGVFHFLPLGLRVLNKLENLIDTHMTSLGASKVSLSSITTEKLWKRSGRYEQNAELLKIKDRKDSKFLLAPTHEEEITALVADLCNSYKDLPIRLYQISRKYRDEKRPRQGLLRAKEFIMKDLYTFDPDEKNALATYAEVVKTYQALFRDLGLDYKVAHADSGNMGGTLSHEFHLLSPDGEDELYICDQCDYTANEEVVEKTTIPNDGAPGSEPPSMSYWVGISRDRKSLVYVFVPGLGNHEASLAAADYDHIDFRAVKSAFPELDTALDPRTDAESLWRMEAKECSVVHIYDDRISGLCTQALQPPVRVPTCSLGAEQHQNEPLHLTKVEEGDSCPRCSAGTLSTKQAIELGHTFHLGTRYSEPLGARVASPGVSKPQALHMGCHGIGVSRVIGAIAAKLHDESGLTWPSRIAPFAGVIIAKGGMVDDVSKVYDALVASTRLDWVIDDRPQKSIGWKLRDADLIGAPIKVVLGDKWEKNEGFDIKFRKGTVDPDLPVTLEELTAVSNRFITTNAE